MVIYNRVIRLPAHIFCNNDRDFVGAALGIPPLRDKINSMSGKLTRQDVVLLAEELYSEYQQICDNDKERWGQIKRMDFDTNSNNVRWTTQNCKRELKRFVKKYSQTEGDEN